MWSALRRRLWVRLPLRLQVALLWLWERLWARGPGRSTGSGTAAPKPPPRVQPTQFPKPPAPGPKQSERRGLDACASRGNREAVVEDLVWLGLPWSYLPRRRR
jgi:hypothetical protein